MELGIEHGVLLAGVLLMAALANVGGIGFAVLYAYRPSFAYSNPQIAFSIGGFVALVSVLLAFPEHLLFINLPNSVYWLVAAPFIALLIVFGEYMINQSMHFAVYRKWTFRTDVYDFYGTSRLSFFALAMVVANVIVEELLIRQVAFDFLLGPANLAPWAVIGISAVLYSANHIAFGLNGLIDKLFAGIVYAIVYHLSGYSIAVVVAVHAIQNLGLVALSTYLARSGR